MVGPNADIIEVHHKGKIYNLQEFILMKNKGQNIWIISLTILSILNTAGLGYLFYILL